MYYTISVWKEGKILNVGFAYDEQGVKEAIEEAKAGLYGSPDRINIVASCPGRPSQKTEFILKDGSWKQVTDKEKDND